MTGTFLTGLVFAAIIGILVTSFKSDELKNDLGYIFAVQRLKQLFSPSGKSVLERLLWACSRALRLEWVCFAIVAWITACLIVMLLGNRLGENSIFDFFFGSLVGLAASPWFWLHFSRDISGSAKDENGNLERYKFLSAVLGIILVAVILSPLIKPLLSRADKVEAWGLAISASDRTSDTRAAVITPGNASASRSTANQRLTSNTHSANRLVTSIDGATLKNSYPNLQQFENLSGIERDSAYIAHLTYLDMNITRGIAVPGGSDLSDYVNKAAILEAPSLAIEPDLRFSKNASPLLACLDYYAQSIADTHLYFLHSGDIVEWLTLQVKRSLNLRSPGLSDVADKDPQQDIRVLAEALRSEIRAIMRRFATKDQWAKVEDLCRPRSTDTDASAPLLPTSATPYPALIAAFSLAAVDSAEAGILTLSDWIKSKGVAHANHNHGRLTIRDQYLIVRSRINLLQIAASELPGQLTTEGLVTVQRETTDNLAGLLRVSSPSDLKARCQDLSRAGLHRQIGRMIAFLYAVERNILFELQDPGLVSASRDSGRTELTGSLEQDLEEAIFIAGTPNCFSGVPRFEGKRRRLWLGQFRLSVAQLRLIKALNQKHVDQVATLADVQRDLDAAENDLGLPPVDASVAPADLLVSGDEFGSQRTRLAKLRALAKNMPQR